MKPALGDRLLTRLGPHYILAMMVGTRIFGSVGGLLVIYYVELTLTLPPEIRLHFRIAAGVVVVVGCTLTVLLALWETRALRAVLHAMRCHQPVDAALLSAAGREAVVFVGRHHRHEAWLVPCSTLVPVVIFLRLVSNADAAVLLNITYAALMGISMALMSTFFAVEYFTEPVIRLLLARGAIIDYDALPKGRLRVRVGVCSVLIIMTTALMISVLARQRAQDIMVGRVFQTEALQNLVTHSTYITIAAITIGIVFFSVLTRSVTSRVAQLVEATDRVRSGNLDVRVMPTGNDEIDLLARRFNAMVEEVSHHNRTIEDLNATLEHRVEERTRQLEYNVRKLKETQAQLVHSEKMSSIGQLTAGLAHEINNAINAVYNGIQPLALKAALVRRLVDTALASVENDAAGPMRREVDKAFESMMRLAKVIEEGASRTARIVGDLRTFAHPGSETPALFDVHLALDMCVNLLSNHLKNRVMVVRNYEYDRKYFGPEHQLNQVFLNILQNAQQAIPDQGEISISTCRDGQWLVIRIRDTGVGIPDAVRSRIFDPFFTTKEPGVGTGLGLSISYGLVTRLGGSIDCDRAEGGGTEFVIRLPERCPPSHNDSPARQSNLELAVS